MSRSPEMYLYDVLRAAKAVQQFVADKTLDDYRGDLMLRSAVERQFEIIGEALTQLRRLDASMVEKIQASFRPNTGMNPEALAVTRPIGCGSTARCTIRP